MLRLGVHFDLRLRGSRCVSRSPPLPSSRIPNRVYGIAGCRNWNLRVPTSTTQYFRSLRAYRLSSASILGARMETRPTSKTPCFPLLDYVSAHMHRNRCELEFALQTRTGLGIREACQWLGTKSTLRCLVRLVRCRWFVT